MKIIALNVVSNTYEVLALNGELSKALAQINAIRHRKGQGRRIVALNHCGLDYEVQLGR